ncbi:MAG: diguanylate phosphodiesterase, partial [Comamonadaceae bacterium]
VGAQQHRRSTEVQARHLHGVADEWSALAGLHLGAPTMLLRADDIEAAAVAIHRRLRAVLRTPVLVCVTPVAVTAELRRPFTLASRCTKILRNVGVSDKPTSTTHLGVYATLFDPDRGDDLRAFLTDTLGALLDYDRRRNTDLVTTLAAYFDNSTNLTRTSKALHVHMNTLVKRLDRIAALIGEDWQQPDNALPLQLAVRLHTLAGGLDSGPRG